MNKKKLKKILLGFLSFLFILITITLGFFYYKGENPFFLMKFIGNSKAFVIIDMVRDQEYETKYNSEKNGTKYIIPKFSESWVLTVYEEAYSCYTYDLIKCSVETGNNTSKDKIQEIIKYYQLYKYKDDFETYLDEKLLILNKVSKSDYILFCDHGSSEPCSKQFEQNIGPQNGILSFNALRIYMMQNNNESEKYELIKQLLGVYQEISLKTDYSGVEYQDAMTGLMILYRNYLYETTSDEYRLKYVELFDGFQSTSSEIIINSTSHKHIEAIRTINDRLNYKPSFLYKHIYSKIDYELSIKIAKDTIVTGTCDYKKYEKYLGHFQEYNYDICSGVKKIKESSEKFDFIKQEIIDL